MNKFLELYNLPRLNQEEIEILNRSITSKEIDYWFKTLPKESSGLDDFTVAFYQTFKKRINTNHSQVPSKNGREENTSKRILQSQHYPDTKTRQ